MLKVTEPCFRSYLNFSLKSESDWPYHHDDDGRFVTQVLAAGIEPYW